MKLVTLNIEGNKHFDTAIPFLKQVDADVVCLQEVFEVDVEMILSSIGCKYWAYAPLMKVEAIEIKTDIAPRGKWGILMATKARPILLDKHYYVGSEETIPVYDNQPNSNNRAVIVAEMPSKDGAVTVATVHHTWAEAKEVSKLQLSSIESLLGYMLSTYGEFALAGDFNSPRGGAAYRRITEDLVDNIPQSITTTLDPNKHRVRNLELVVDYVFTTPQYKVSNVSIDENVSDHMAITAQIQKA